MDMPPGFSESLHAAEPVNQNLHDSGRNLPSVKSGVNLYSGADDGFPLAPGPVETQPDLFDDPSVDPDSKHIELGAAKSIVARARLLSDRVFKEAKRLPPYKGQLATRERLVEFGERVLEVAILENKKLRKPLEAPQVREVAAGVCAAVARYEHSPQRQRMRQAQQVAARRRGNRGRDLQIVRMRENGLSLRAISERCSVSVGAVRKVLDRAQKAASDTSDTAAG